MKKIALAADHRGFDLKEKLIPFLKAKGMEVLDYGTHSEESCDYPDYMVKAAEAVAKGRASEAIGICHTGVGSAIAANKVKGIRAALVQNVEQARLSRAHNNSNMLILGSGFITAPTAKKIITAWLNTQFEGGRHARRVDKITGYEKRNQSSF